MTLLIGSWTVGLILAILALGVFISFRIFCVSRHHGRREFDPRARRSRLP